MQQWIGGEPHSPEPVNALSRAFWNSAVLRAGIRLGVFSLLSRENLTSEGVARRLSANPRFTEAFLHACAALGLLEVGSDGTFRNSPMAERFLVPGRQEYVGDLALHITNHWAVWGQLDELIRQGRTLLAFESGFVDAPTYWRDYMMGQHNRAISGQAQELVKHVDLRGKRKLLDLGGGQGSYSIALAEAYPELIAINIDCKEALEIARELVAQHNLQERVLLREGDIDTMELDRDADVILISGVLLIKSEEESRRLLRRCYEALLPGGTIILQDFFRIGTSPERRFLDTMMDLYVIVCFYSGGGDRDGDTIAGWLTDSGFSDPVQIPLPTHLALVVATKK
jgi:cyclopropane fatty-acyl-phospholipid synthase-like methyltransferase